LLQLLTFFVGEADTTGFFVGVGVGFRVGFLVGLIVGCHDKIKGLVSKPLQTLVPSISMHLHLTLAVGFRVGVKVGF
jgi:hypothetical protein